MLEEFMALTLSDWISYHVGGLGQTREIFLGMQDCNRAKLFGLFNSILILACIFPTAFRQIVPAINMLIIKGIRLEA